jgi:hypothetical protein
LPVSATVLQVGNVPVYVYSASHGRHLCGGVPRCGRVDFLELLGRMPAVLFRRRRVSPSRGNLLSPELGMSSHRPGLAWCRAVFVLCGTLFASVAASAAAPSGSRLDDYPGLSPLIHAASEIVVGRTLSSERLLARGENGAAELLLKYRVTEVLKGELPVGAVVTIGVRPSEIREETAIPKITADASAAREAAAHVTTDGQYLLFMNKARRRNGFAVVGGGQGAFELQDRVIPCSTEPEAESWRRRERLDRNDFLAAVRSGTGATR